MHALVVGRGEAPGTPEGHSICGFRMYQEELRDQLGLTIDVVQTTTLADIDHAVRTRPADVAFILVHWGEDPQATREMFQRFWEMPGRSKLVFLDYCASTASPHYAVLPYVDRFAKRQILEGDRAYSVDFEGGCVFTDYLANQLDYDLDGWYFGSEADPNFTHKVVLSWNLGVTPKYRRLLRSTSLVPLPWGMRPFDVNCRLGMSVHAEPRDWYERYRRMSLELMEPLNEDFRCTGTTRIRRKLFMAEMALSKLVISPFGWGETCFRDYEAVCAGALLVKPSMDHLKTSPDIYVKGETYVACEWDLSNVTDVCREYLANPKKAKKIAANAREVMRNYYNRNGFVNDVRRVLDGVFSESEVENARHEDPSAESSLSDDVPANPRQKVQRLIKA